MRRGGPCIRLIVVLVLVVVSFWYLLCTSILTVFQRRIEDYYGRGVVSAGQLRPAKASRRAKKAAA